MMQQQIVTEKHLDTIAMSIRPDTHLICFEGTIRSSKTVDAVSCFYMAVRNSPDYLHCICARDYDAIRDNILDCNGLGLAKKYPVERHKEAIGGYFYTMKGKDGREKMILLAGYSNVKQWTKILGKTLGVILIDEVNIADEQFIDEAFARQASADKPLMIWTLNGDNPDHFVYQKYINYCKPLGVVPASILEDMLPVENKPGWFYWHWTMQDNPAMTPEKIERASSMYPVGSYYYNIKILGIRGAPEGSIFAQYLDDSFFTKKIRGPYKNQIIECDEVEYLLKTGQYMMYNFGLDLGNNDIKQGTILTFVGIRRGYKAFDVIDTYQCKATESQALVEEITSQLRKWHNEILNVTSVDSIRIDGFGAIQVLVPTIRKSLVNKQVNSFTDMALKFGEDGGRMARLVLILIAVSRHAINFSARPGARQCYNMLRRLVYDVDGLPLDKNEIQMDYYDSLGYCLTPHTRRFTDVWK